MGIEEVLTAPRFSVAERGRGAVCRLRSSRVPRPSRRVDGSWSAQHPEIARRVLHGVAHASVARERLPRTAACQSTALRADRRHPAGRRPPPPVRTSRGVDSRSTRSASRSVLHSHGVKRSVDVASGGVNRSRTAHFSARACCCDVQGHRVSLFRDRRDWPTDGRRASKRTLRVLDRDRLDSSLTQRDSRRGRAMSEGQAEEKPSE